MDSRTEIGVRYCGGCNPRYDRTAAVQALEKLLPGWEIVPVQPGADCPAAVVVCGCPARCAGTNDLNAPLVYVKDMRDVGPAAEALSRLLGVEGGGPYA